MRKNNFEVPILFLVFNRFDTAQNVFEEIRKIKPKKLFVASDGPRKNKSGEKEIVESVRKYILSNINWECDVKTLFRNKNLGCKYAVSSAVDWFFENVEEGIILEDDCLPSQSFFRFCKEMLEKYRADKDVMHITGTNIDGGTNIKESYFFSSIPNIWGWAAWRETWRGYDVEMSSWPKYRSISSLRSLGYRGFLTILKTFRLFELTYRNKINTWDYQFDFHFRKNKKLSIVPKVNLITNIGIGGGTHTFNYTDEKKYKKYDLQFPLIHPLKILENHNYFKRYAKKYSVKFSDVLRNFFKSN
jgi:hypothetical protein